MHIIKLEHVHTHAVTQIWSQPHIFKNSGLVYTIAFYLVYYDGIVKIFNYKAIMVSTNFYECILIYTKK